MARVFSPVFAMAFRVLFLAAGTAALFTNLIWTTALAGKAQDDLAAVAHVGWHAHEMVFGFVAPLIAGFVLTAAPKWTRTTPVAGGPLVVLAGLWAVGRISPFLHRMAGADDAMHLIGQVTGVLGASFLPLTAVYLWRALLSTRNTRNYGVGAVVTVLALAGIGAQAERLGLVSVSMPALARHAVWGVAVLLVVIGGRITPAFTRNRFKSAGVRSTDVRDKAAIAATVLVAALSPLGLPGVVIGGLAILAAALNAWRMQGWGTRAAFGDALLLMLHLGYAWVVLGLVLLGVAHIVPDTLPVSTALHGLTAGAIGTYGLGMMARVTLGHTGRRLRATPPLLAAFGCVLLAGLTRVFGPLLQPGDTLLWWIVAGLLWVCAFGLWLWHHAPALGRPRVDERDG